MLCPTRSHGPENKSPHRGAWFRRCLPDRGCPRCEVDRRDLHSAWDDDRSGDKLCRAQYREQAQAEAVTWSAAGLSRLAAHHIRLLRLMKVPCSADAKAARRHSGPSTDWRCEHLPWAESVVDRLLPRETRHARHAFFSTSKADEIRIKEPKFHPPPSAGPARLCIPRRFRQRHSDIRHHGRSIASDDRAECAHLLPPAMPRHCGDLMRAGQPQRRRCDRLGWTEDRIRSSHSSAKGALPETPASHGSCDWRWGPHPDPWAG